MDENTNTTPTNGEAITLELQEFQEGDFKGFKYAVPSHNVVGRKVTMEVDEGVAKALERYGDTTLLRLFDDQVMSRLRTKVKNALPKGLNATELAAKRTEILAKHPDGILLTSEEALAWRPDRGELSPNQLFKRAKDAFTQAAQETDPAKKMELLAKGQQYLVDMGKAMVAA